MKILIAVDGSACSNAAVRFVASRLLPHLGAEARVKVLNVQPPLPAYPARMAGASRVRAWHEAEAKKALAPATALLRKAGIDADSRYVLGSPGSTVSAIAARDADLVVMGSHGHSAVAGMLFGSVTHTVLATCSTPLLIVRAQRLSARGAAEPLRVGVAVDGSRQSLETTRYAMEHRALFGPNAEITLLSVVPDLLLTYIPGFAEISMPTFSPEQASEMQREAFAAAIGPVRKMLAREELAWPAVRLVGNSPGDCIADYATQNRLDLLVLGSHGYGAVKSVALGSVATRVAAHCKTPLLLVRSTAGAAQKRPAAARSQRSLVVA